MYGVNTQTSIVFMQSKLLDHVQNKDIVLSGDGRCDSPGKSAKYCTYSLLDTDTGYILHCETIDKREVGLQSPNMEKEALLGHYSSCNQGFVA